MGSQGLSPAPACVGRRRARGVPRCSDVRPSGTLLVWALLLAGWLGCSPCLVASWDHVLRVPREGRERCRFKEEQHLGCDLDFFPPFSVFLLPCTTLGKLHLRFWDPQDAPSPRLQHRGAAWLCGVAVGQLVPRRPWRCLRCPAVGPPGLLSISRLEGESGWMRMVCVPQAPGELPG